MEDKDANFSMVSVTAPSVQRPFDSELPALNPIENMEGIEAVVPLTSGEQPKPSRERCISAAGDWACDAVELANGSEAPAIACRMTSHYSGRGNSIDLRSPGGIKVGRHVEWQPLPKKGAPGRQARFRLA